MGTLMQRRTISTSAELRSAIDRGLTGDKIAALDPAAAPLGTDDEAAGVSVDPSLIAEVTERELQAGDQIRESGSHATSGETDGVLPWLLVAAFLLAAVGMVWFGMAYA